MPLPPKKLLPRRWPFPFRAVCAISTALLTAAGSECDKPCPLISGRSPNYYNLVTKQGLNFDV